MAYNYQMTGRVRYLSILFFWLWGSSLALGQTNTKVDSLLGVLNKYAGDTSRVKVLFELYNVLLYNEKDKAAAYLEEAFELSKELKFDRGLILCYDKLGGLSMVNSEYREAINYFRKADSLLQYDNWPREKAVIYGNMAAIYQDLNELDSTLYWNEKFLTIAEQINNQGFIAFAKTLNGDIYHDRGQNELAARYYLQALRIYEKEGDQVRLADSYRLLGATQTAFISYEDARRNLLKAVEIYKQLNDEYYLAQAYRDLGYNSYLQEEYEQANNYYQQSLEIVQRIDDPFGLAQTYDNFGEINLDLKEFEQALSFFNQALSLFIDVEDYISAGQTYNSIGKVHLGLYQYKRAMEANRQAEKIFKSVDSPGSIKNVYLLDYKIHKALKEPDRALNAYLKYSEISDSLFTLEKATRLSELQIIYNIEKKDQEIQILSKDVAIGHLRRRLLIIGILALSVIAAFIIGIILIRRNKERKIAEERSMRQQLELEKSQLEKNQLERELAAQALQLCRKNELLNNVQQQVSRLSKPDASSDKSDLRKLERTIEHSIQSDEDWSQFLSTFEKVHPHYLEQLQQTVKLSPAEQRLACLFKINLSSKDIATMLNISDEGVKKARYRLRKKLNIPSNINLQEYLINFSAMATVSQS